jgi:hypothetical protein
MFLLPPAFLVAIALTIWLVLVCEAAVPVKVAAAALFVFSLRLLHTRFGMEGLILQVVMSIFIPPCLKTQER